MISASFRPNMPEPLARIPSAFFAALGLAATLTAPAVAEEVEIKFVVRAEQVAAALEAFPTAHAEVRDIYFVETDDQELAAKNLILRLRAKPGKKDDSTVKLRGEAAVGVSQEEFPLGDNGDTETKLESDRVLGGSTARSFSLTTKLNPGEVAALVKGDRKLEQLFPPAQKKFLLRFASGLDWSKARWLGPVKTEKWACRIPGFAPEVTAELWTLPRGTPSQLLEFSLKVDTAEAAAAADELTAALARKGLTLAEKPDSKTRFVLGRLLKGE
jgi:hypothetical protein